MSDLAEKLPLATDDRYGPDVGTLNDTGVLDYGSWRGHAQALHRQFVTAQPFPHLVLDDFLTPDAARAVLDSFPPPGDGWIHYLHYNEHTLGMNDPRHLPEAARWAFEELNSERFVSLLGEITGIPALQADHTLEGGGLHLSESGGYLNLHADFTVHPHRPEWRRRLNLLVFLNPEWRESWGGHVELWDAEVRCCVQRIAPLYNRAILFRTDERSFHGYPDPIRCPEGLARKSLALYYFTAEARRPHIVSTEYRGRPGDGTRRALIFLDKMALRMYDRAKRTFGFDDRLVSWLLRSLSRQRPDR